MIPAFTYQIDFLPNSGWQAISSSDRTLCASISALAALRQGHTLGGIAKRLAPDAVVCALLRHTDDCLVPRDRVNLWAGAVAQPEAHRIPAGLIPAVVDGLTVSNYQNYAITNTTVAGGVLDLGCGLGKTLTTAAMALALARHPQIHATRCWIVCPVNAFGAWQRFIPALKAVYADVQVISMDSLHKMKGCANIGGIIIFDEVHLLGEPTARRTACGHEVRLTFDAGFSLTGTLNHGGIHKALSILDLALPGASWFSNRWRCGEYFRCLVRKQLGSRSVTSLARPVGPARQLYFEYLSRYTVALTKHSEIVRRELELPEQHLHLIEVGDCDIGLDNLAADYVRAYILEHGEIPEAAKVAHALARMGITEKIALLDAELDDEPMAIFAGYTESLDACELWLQDRGVSYVRVDGGVTGSDRMAAQRNFQAGDAQVFLGQQHAAAISMDLFAATTSVSLDTNWSAFDYAQMLARTCRRGQMNVCHHIDLVANRFQRTVINKLREAENFDAQCVEYQDIRRAVQTQGI